MGLTVFKVFTSRRIFEKNLVRFQFHLRSSQTLRRPRLLDRILLTTNIDEKGSMSDFDVTEFLTMQSFESTTVGKKSVRNQCQEMFSSKNCSEKFSFQEQSVAFQRERRVIYATTVTTVTTALQRGVTSINKGTVKTTVTGVIV